MYIYARLGVEYFDSSSSLCVAESGCCDCIINFTHADYDADPCKYSNVIQLKFNIHTRSRCMVWTGQHCLLARM